MNPPPAPCSDRPRNAPWLERALRGLRLGDRPLAAKLALLLTLGSTVTALFAWSAVMAIGWRGAEKHQRDEGYELARMMAYALRVPVSVENKRAIAENLTALAARQDVQAAWAWSAEGQLLGSIGSTAPQRPGADHGGLWQGWRDTTQAISSSDGTTPTGYVVLRMGLTEYRQILLAQALAVALGALFALGLSLLLVRRVARHLAQPLVKLADAAGDIAAGQHYEYRLPVAGQDEVGRAVRAFNAMIDEVAARGAALTTANRGLEQRVAERTAALEREKERAEAASLAKTRFLANMSHELRTPLNGVIGAAQLLRDQGDEVHRRHELVEIIRGSGNSLLGLIDSVLDLARIENGSLTLDCEDFNLADAVESVALTAAAAARAKGLQLVCDIDPTLALWRHGDSLRLRQLLLNLLGNATKFTLHGEVVLRVSAAADAVCFEVRDTGVGMTEATLAHIFEPFRQAEDGSTRRFGGSGLGLAICRELVTLMGGRIEVASQLQQGSTFIVTLPLPCIAAPPSAPPLGYRVAFIEPHEASARALASLLARMGCQALPCRSADDLRAAMALPDDQGRPPWLLVAADDASSLELMQAAAADIDPQRVIGMDHAEWYAADVARDGLQLARSVIKPVLRAALVSRFGAVQRTLAAPLAAPSGADDGATALRAGRVLVVEDDPVNQTIVASMLTQAGFSVEVASDGYGALQTFGAMRFDLVLMDWQMPDMDGLEVTRRLRSGAAGGRGLTTPIVALTANAFAEDRAACLAAGMNDFLTKPVRVDQLVRTVNRWIAAPATDRPAPVKV